MSLSESLLFRRPINWGNEMWAQLGGSSATVRPQDPVHAAYSSIQSHPLPYSTSNSEYSPYIDNPYNTTGFFGFGENFAPGNDPADPCNSQFHIPSARCGDNTGTNPASPINQIPPINPNKPGDIGRLEPGFNDHAGGVPEGFFDAIWFYAKHSILGVLGLILLAIGIWFLISQTDTYKEAKREVIKGAGAAAAL